MTIASRAGMTLVEMLVVLTILGVLAAVVAPSFAERSGGAATRRESLDQARDSALAAGTAVEVPVGSSVVRFLPDGRALGAGVDPLTGAPIAAPEGGAPR